MSQQYNKTIRPIFKIRPARKEEAGSLADLHFRAYANRFFDPLATGRDGKPYGAPLASEFPQLAQGQNAVFFHSYWSNFVKKLDWPDRLSRNFCFVAETGSKKLQAFVKGAGAPVSDDATIAPLFNRAADRNPAMVPARQCAELASIYCDPQSKYRGLGRQLASVFARAMLDLGYKGMITRAYARNDSVEFFMRLGALPMGYCEIPNEYLTPEGRVKSVSIPGRWLYWSPAALRKLAADAPGPS